MDTGFLRISRLFSFKKREEPKIVSKEGSDHKIVFEEDWGDPTYRKVVIEAARGRERESRRVAMEFEKTSAGAERQGQ